MKFKSRKNIIFQLMTLFFFGISSFSIYRIFSGGIENYEFEMAEILLLLCTLYILWTYFGTQYELNKTELIYKSGLIRGKIKIESINEVETNKNVWAGIRPATAINGILVKYKKYDDVFISPKNEERFISKLLELNTKITVTKN